MTDARADQPFRRILVALDATAESLAALEVAAFLAEGLKSELAGLFIEDQELFRLAELPIAREVTLPGRGRAPSFDAASLEAQLRTRAATARQAMERHARQRRIGWSFKIVRGRAETLIVEAAAKSDVVTLGKWLGAVSRETRLECAARIAAAKAYGAALFMGASGRFRPGRVVCVYDAGAGAAEALELAARVAETAGQPLTVEIFAENAASGEARRATVESRLAEWGGRVRLAPVFGTTRLLADLAAVRNGLIVVPTSTAATLCERFEDFLEVAHCPVLMLEGGARTP